MVSDWCTDGYSPILIPAISAVSEAFSNTGIGIGTSLNNISDGTKRTHTHSHTLPPFKGSRGQGPSLWIKKQHIQKPLKGKQRLKEESLWLFHACEWYWPWHCPGFPLTSAHRHQRAVWERVRDWNGWLEFWKTVKLCNLRQQWQNRGLRSCVLLQRHMAQFTEFPFWECLLNSVWPLEELNCAKVKQKRTYYTLNVCF